MTAASTGGARPVHLLRLPHPASERPGLAADPNELTVSIAESPPGRCASPVAPSAPQGAGYPRLTVDAVMRLVIEHRAHVAEGGAR